RGGSVCLNSFGRFAKWISASIMPPPSLVSAR
ncbi:LysR family transcriptional regulator, partial [Rhizobium anhuiense]